MVRSIPASRRRRVARLAAAALAALLAGCTTTPRRQAVPAPPAPAVVLPRAIRVGTATGVVAVPLEDYVLGSVLAELTPLDESDAVVARAYEVQSILARTYVVSELGRHRAEGFDVCDTTHCQIYDPARITASRFAAAARAAVGRTRGRILVYGGHAAEALFHADCGGQTTAADAVWGGPAVPYLVGVPDEVPAGAHRAWHVSVTGEQLRAALNADSRTAVGRRLDAVEILSRDRSGRAAGLGVRGERGYTVRGDVLRSVLNASLGPRAIQSTRFTLRHSGANYIFDGTGFGHGVGLCQRGALARARRGDTAEAILGTYFPGAALR